jgi:hypothetical protein
LTLTEAIQKYSADGKLFFQSQYFLPIFFLWLLHLGEFLGNQIKLKIKKTKTFG